MATITASATGGNWSATAAWVGGVVPGSGDDVLLTATSGNITLDASATNLCKTIDCTGYVGTLTLASSQTFSIAGNKLKLVNTMTLTLSGTIGTFLFTDATSETCAITTGGRTMPNMTTGSGLTSSSTTYQLQDTFSMGSTSTFTHTCGTLDFNGQTATIGIFSSTSSNTRTILLNTATVNLTGSGATVWSINTNGTGLTLTAGTSQITCQTGSNQGFQGGSKTYYNVSFTGSVQPVINDSNTFNNLTRTGTASATDQFKLNANQTVNGIFTVTGNSTINRMFLTTNISPTAVTVTVNGSFSFTNVDFRGITAAGTAGTWTGSQMGNGLNNSNITFDNARTLYWVATTGGNWNATTSWSLSSGGSSGQNPPLPQDTPVFDSNSITSASRTITVGMPRLGAILDLTNLTNSPTYSATLQWTVFGDVKLISAITYTGTGALLLYGTGSQKLTTAGKTLSAFTIDAVGGTYQLQDNLTDTGTITHTSGTFDANNKNLTIPAYSSSGTGARTLLMGTGTWTLNGTGTIWNTGTITNFTQTNSTSTITPTDTSASTKTFSMGTGQTMPSITVPNNSSGAYIFTAAGNMTLGGTFTFGTGTTHTFTNGKTYTFSNAPVLNGSSGNVITINSSSSGNAATFSYTGAGVVSGTYLNIKDNTPTQTNIWFAGHNSTSVSNTGNWIFDSGFAVVNTGTLSFSGGATKQINIPLTAGMSFGGAFSWDTGAPFAGTLSMGGTFAHQPNKVLTATLNLNGAISRFINYIMNGNLGFVGSENNQTSRSLTASLSFSGSFSKTIIKSYLATLSFAGTISRQSQKVFNAALGFVTQFNKFLGRTLTATLNFTGQLLRPLLRSFIATLNLSSSFVKSVVKTFSGTVRPVGSFLKSVQKAFAAILPFSTVGTNTPAGFGNTGFGNSYFAQGNLTASGSPAQLVVTFLRSKGLWFTGSVGIFREKNFTANLTMQGTANKAITKQPFTANLSFVGGLLNPILRFFIGALGFVGSIFSKLIPILTRPLFLDSNPTTITRLDSKPTDQTYLDANDKDLYL